MEYPHELLMNMVNYLKNDKKMSISQIEKELNFSNGLLWKATKNKTTLSEDKIGKLGKLYFDKMNEGKKLGYIKILPDGKLEFGELGESGEKTPIQTIDAPKPKRMLCDEIGHMEVPAYEEKPPEKQKGEGALDYEIRLDEFYQNKKSKNNDI